MSDVKSFFSGLAERVDKSKIAGMNKSFLFNLSGENGGTFLVKVADGSVTVEEGATEGGDVELGMTAEDLVKLEAAARHAVIIRSGNMSLGVNLLAGLVEKIARTLG
ncbi:MAG TPA: SCP2 sterol-binding domain-containing protein, partial [Candidatus Hydrogenedentes bacterium]|nr:SCP2 sterol-binding domain-containing protein [Candidatus Hydrogenedentota bacterium]